MTATSTTRPASGFGPLLSRAFCKRHALIEVGICIVALTLLRIIFLFLTQVDLGADEAQYWWWAQHPAMGYYSKPPMIAWVIWATTSIFGDASWAIRLMSPLLHGAGALVIFAIAQKLYNKDTALWAALAWVTLPIVSGLSIVISTDTPLLFFWSLALLSFVGLAQSATTRVAMVWGLALGVFIGLGFLSKYAMIYFPLGIALATCLSPLARKAIRLLPLLLTAATAFLIVLPNILWNAQNNFQTLSHTKDNANWSGQIGHLENFLEFFGAQFAVAGPLIFGVIIIGVLYRFWPRRNVASNAKNADLLLIGFTLPPLLILFAQAYIARANANWAVAAYPAGVIFAIAIIIRARYYYLAALSTGLHVLLLLFLLVGGVNFSLMDKLGASNAVKRVRGWETQANQIMAVAQNHDVVIVDDRELMGSLLYYMRELKKPILAWNQNRRIDNHYEAFFPYTSSYSDKALLVTKYPQYYYYYTEFKTKTPIGISQIDLNVPCARRYGLFALSGYTPPSRKDWVHPKEPVEAKAWLSDCRAY